MLKNQHTFRVLLIINSWNFNALLEAFQANKQSKVCVADFVACFFLYHFLTIYFGIVVTEFFFLLFR